MTHARRVPASETLIIEGTLLILIVSSSTCSIASLRCVPVVLVVQVLSVECH